MAKATKEQLEKAKAFYEIGKSVREIEKETGIPFNTVAYHAKKNGWEKEKLVHLVAERTRVIEDFVQHEKEFVQLSQIEQKVIDDESETHRVFKGYRNKIAQLAFDRIAKELPACEVQHVKPLIEAADKTCVMAEIAPRYNANAGTNITNQQNTQFNEAGERTGERGFALVFEDANHERPTP